MQDGQVHNGAYTLGVVNTVLDHSLKKNNGYASWQYGTLTDKKGDGLITMFNGARASGPPKTKDVVCIGSGVSSGDISLDGLTNTSGCGAGYVSYDEHPGYDYYALCTKRGIYCIDGTGTPVTAVASGTVINNGGERCIKTYAFDPNTGAPCDAWGWVGIDHGNGYISQYGHLQVSDIKVTAGQKVTKGQLIGLSGKTTPPTDSVGPHLHFEVLKFVNGQYLFVDPYGWSSTTELDPLYCPDQITCLAARPVSTRLWE